MSVEDKADPALRRALAQAPPGEMLTVVAELPAAPADEPEVAPTAFSTRQEYRQALIDRQRSRLSQRWSEAAERIRQTGADVHGGALSGVLVVKGTAAQIEAALRSGGISRASLDRSMSLIEPRRPARKEP